jgi:hypothetical protein
MLRESKQLIRHTIREDLPVNELFTANYSFINKPLADFYGVQGPQTTNLEKVSLVDTERLGILTHASFLTLSSHKTLTSPVLRGKYVLDQLLCDAPPPPPPEAEGLSDHYDPNKSKRENLEAHTKNPNCASCHKVMDPIGFSFENFDEIGRWRLTENGFDVDPTGHLPSGEYFTDHKDMIHILQSKNINRCTTQKLITYALGKGMDTQSKCAAHQTLQNIDNQQPTFKDIIKTIVKSDIFQKTIQASGE